MDMINDEERKLLMRKRLPSTFEGGKLEQLPKMIQDLVAEGLLPAGYTEKIYDGPLQRRYETRGITGVGPSFDWEARISVSSRT